MSRAKFGTEKNKLKMNEKEIEHVNKKMFN